MKAQAPKRGRGRPRKHPAPIEKSLPTGKEINLIPVNFELGVSSGTIDIVSEPERLDDHQLVVFSLRSILTDPMSSAASKASAARTLAEINGQLGKNAKPPVEAGKPLSEMTRDELEAELLREA